MNSDKLIDYLVLSLTPHIGPISFANLIKKFPNISDIFWASKDEIISCLERPHAVDALLSKKALPDAHKAIEWSQKNANCKVMTLLDSDYPMCLAHGMAPPPVLFLRGRVDLLENPMISIVGSRKATPQALSIAKDFGQELSSNGITVVSGFADGIDSAAHNGALLAQASTIGVLGTGIDRVYPAKNHNLAHETSEKGLLISEFPLGTTPNRENFPRRNRIIAALSMATVVIEAAERSGSLITARLAGELGRDVMAVPGSILNPQTAGCHKIIREGAVLVTSVADILEECEHSLKTFRQPETNIQSEKQLEKNNKNVFRQPENINSNQQMAIKQENSIYQTVLDAMGFDVIHPDLLSQNLQIHPSDLYAILLDLELEGKIASISGGCYQRL